MSTYLKIGKTLKAHGIKGELRIAIDDVFFDEIEELKALFLDIKGQKIPFFIEHLRGEALDILKLEETKDRSGAELYQFKDIYVRREDISLSDAQIKEEQELPFQYLQGFVLVDAELGEVGEIAAIEEYPQQMMAVIRKEGKEWLIPLVKPFIQREDHSARRIYMDLPQGLLDLSGDNDEVDNDEADEDVE